MDAPHIDIYCTGCYRNRTHVIVYTTETMARLSCEKCSLTSDIDAPEVFVNVCRNIMACFIAKPRVRHVPGSPGAWPKKKVVRINSPNIPFWWREMCLTYKGMCAKCGKKRPLTRDHIIPKSHGGKGDKANIQPLCEPCNSAKGATYADYRWKDMGGD